MPRGQQTDSSVTIDASEFAALVRATRGFDRKLATALRRRIREAAKPIAEDVKKTIRRIPATGRAHVGTREAIAKGVAIRVMTAQGGNRQGVKVEVTPRGMTGEMAKHKGALRAFNATKFRHPVFGRRRFVSQQGRRYFGEISYGSREKARKEIIAALEDAVKQMKL